MFRTYRFILRSIYGLCVARCVHTLGGCGTEKMEAVCSSEECTTVRAVLSAQYCLHYQGSLSGISGEQFVTLTVSTQIPRFILLSSHSTNTPCSFIYHLRDGQCAGLRAQFLTV